MSLDQRSTTSRRGHTLLFAFLQVAITVGIFSFLASQWGMTPFMDAFRLLPLWIFPAAALLGGVGVLTQALRWRVIARHHQISIGVGPAVARCWQAAFLNGVLPGVWPVMRCGPPMTAATQRSTPVAARCAEPSRPWLPSA